MHDAPEPPASADLDAARAEIERLRGVEAVLRALLDAAPELLFAKDREGRLLVANAAVRAVFDLGEAFVGHTSADLHAARSTGEASLVNDLRIMEAGVAEVLDERAQTPRGLRLFRAMKAPLRDAAGEVVGLIGVSRDITHERRMEAALRESDERLRAIAESLPSAAFVLDPDGTAQFLNQRWVEYTGSDAVDVASRVALMHEDDQAAVTSAWAEARRTRGELRVECRLRGWQGEHRWFLLRARPLLDEAGAITRWVGSASDIHDLRLAQAALQRSEAEARAAAAALSEEAQRKDTFLAMLSHELRNPLAPARAAWHVLTRAEPGSPPHRRATETIGRQLDHLARLVDDLLDTTRLTRGLTQLRLEPVDAAELVAGVVADHEPFFASAGVALELSASARPVVSADPARLAQVLANLLQNACKFTPAGGRVEVTLGADEAAGRAEIRVRDTGEGIAPDLLPHVFEVFSQAGVASDRRRGGLGLGLSMVKGLVGLHDGEVEVQSDGPGTGTTVFVRLPLGAPPPPAVTTAPPPSPRARRVLLVEDDPEVLHALRAALELEGHTVAVAETGPEAIDLAPDFRPEVVLCDIGLPGMDGHAVARAFRADPALARTFLVALTGYAQKRDVAAALAAGFDRHLAKPASMERIEEALAAVPSL